MTLKNYSPFMTCWLLTISKKQDSEKESRKRLRIPNIQQRPFSAINVQLFRILNIILEFRRKWSDFSLKIGLV